MAVGVLHEAAESMHRPEKEGVVGAKAATPESRRAIVTMTSFIATVTDSNDNDGDYSWLKYYYTKQIILFS